MKGWIGYAAAWFVAACFWTLAASNTGGGLGPLYFFPFGLLIMSAAAAMGVGVWWLTSSISLNWQSRTVLHRSLRRDGDLLRGLWHGVGPARCDRRTHCGGDRGDSRVARHRLESADGSLVCTSSSPASPMPFARIAGSAPRKAAAADARAARPAGATRRAARAGEPALSVQRSALRGRSGAAAIPCAPTRRSSASAICSGMRSARKTRCCSHRSGASRRTTWRSSSCGSETG